MDIIVRPAVLSDLEAAISILREAADWLEQKGEPLWQASLFNVEMIEPMIRSNELIVAETAEGAAVAVVLRQWDDLIHWPDKEPGEAVYLQKLAVRRSHAGQGLDRLGSE